MLQSLARFRTERIDLMQVHNLLDWLTHLPTLRDWKADGRLRYIGITHHTTSAMDDLAGGLQSGSLDSVQPPYSLALSEGEQREQIGRGAGRETVNTYWEISGGHDV